MMFYYFEILTNAGTEDEYWQKVTLDNAAQLEGFFTMPATIRRLKVWGPGES